MKKINGTLKEIGLQFGEGLRKAESAKKELPLTFGLFAALIILALLLAGLLGFAGWIARQEILNFTDELATREKALAGINSRIREAELRPPERREIWGEIEMVERSNLWPGATFSFAAIMLRAGSVSGAGVLWPLGWRKAREARQELNGALFGEGKRCADFGEIAE